MTTALSSGIRRVAARLAPDPTPDGELLARFLASRDEAAFAALVRRHAAMVFGTCRRVLGNASDADDAFQAAFVVLVRKAHSLTDRPCVGNFLYGVAFHTALKARAMATKRKAKEMKASRERERPESDELSRALNEELTKLPEKYREPVVLCELEGVSRKDAAARLGIPEGTISSRLATAHRMLERRLTARGFAAAGISALLGGQAFAVSDSLADAAVRAAVGGPPAGVTHLAAEVTKMFLLTKLKVGTAVLACVAMLLSVGAGMVLRGTAADDNPGLKAAPVKPGPKKDEDAIQGLWQAESLEAEGLKAPDQSVKAFQIRFQGNAITFLPDNRTHTFELDPKASPKAMNLTPGDGDAKGKKLECAIYELDGDTLKICMDKEGQAGKRPTEFKTGPKDGLAVIALKRVKEEKANPDRQGGGEARKPDDPAWKAEFRTAYGLADGQLVRRVAPPYPESRAEYFRDLIRGLYRRNKLTPDEAAVNKDYGDHRTKFGWKDGWPVDGLTAHRVPVKPDEGVPLDYLLDVTLGFARTRIEADVTTLERKATGDFVVRAGADPEKAAVQLEAILRKELDLPVTFSFKNAEEEVFVLGGTYAAKPLADRSANEVEVYAAHLTDRSTGGGGSGTLTEMLAAVERHVGKPVVLGQVLGGPKRVIWHYNVRSPMLRDPAKGIDTYREDTNPAVVLANVAAQTGLTVTTEKRTVRVLVVQHAEGTK